MSANGPADPVCTRCKTTSSILWQRDSEGEVICLDCHMAEKNPKPAQTSSGGQPSSKEGERLSSSQMKHTPSSSFSSKSSQPASITQPDTASSGMVTRRTTRSHERAKARLQAQQANTPTPPPPPPPPPTPFPNDSSTPPTPNITDTTSQLDTDNLSTTTPANTPVGPAPVGPTPVGPTPAGPEVEEHTHPASPVHMTTHSSAGSNSKNRRSLIQGHPMQAPQPQPYMVTTNSIQHNGILFEVGDIVSLLDRDGGVYYAIAQGFLLDQYADKYVVLTWLLPKHPNPTHFDPGAFILGPEEDVPRAMDYVEFVCHSPQSRHFQNSYFHDVKQAQLWFTSAQ